MTVQVLKKATIVRNSKDTAHTKVFLSIDSVFYPIFIDLLVDVTTVDKSRKPVKYQIIIFMF